MTGIDARSPLRSALATAVAAGIAGLLVAASPRSLAETPPLPADAGARLVAAYPDALDRVEGDDLVWRDGTRTPIGTVAERPAAETLARPTVADIFRWPYPAGAAVALPAADHDPGRARPRAFFDRMYGDCAKGGVADKLVDVAWLPSRGGRTLRVTRVNGVAGHLAAVSRELDRLPRSYDRYLLPPAGAYNCRPIAGTERMSAHGYGIAIDIAAGPASYWRWDRRDKGPPPTGRNRIPAVIVSIFERHGFIWGGRWSHYDTMHFEYRPELAGPVAP